MEVLREGSVAHRCEFHGKALARRTNAVEFSDLDCHSLARPRVASRISWGVFGFNGTKPAFKAGFAGMPAQVGMTP